MKLEDIILRRRAFARGYAAGLAEGEALRLRLLEQRGSEAHSKRGRKSVRPPPQSTLKPRPPVQ